MKKYENSPMDILNKEVTTLRNDNFKVFIDFLKPFLYFYFYIKHNIILKQAFFLILLLIVNKYI